MRETSPVMIPERTGREHVPEEAVQDRAVVLIEDERAGREAQHLAVDLDEWETGAAGR